MPINFKSDYSFLKKLIIGAAGTNSTIHRLRELGFNPIELERGSTGYKIWKKIKIKRIRVPDILCLKTGIRFESRGKTKAEISMSHSMSNPDRQWDAGLKDEDYISVVMFSQDAINIHDVKQISPVHFISVKDLRNSFEREQVKITKPKGFEEGSEIRVMWTAAFANKDSKVSSITEKNVVMHSLDANKKQTVILSRKGGKIILVPQVKENQVISRGQIVASVVATSTSLSSKKTVNEDFFAKQLKSVNMSDRYAAAKALRHIGYVSSKALLLERMEDPSEDIYVQLEAAAALAAYNHEPGWKFIEKRLIYRI